MKPPEWTSAHLYHGDRPEELLAAVLKPLVEELLAEGLAEGFFFIRYGERGAHVRLRLRGRREVLEPVLRSRLAARWPEYLPASTGTEPEEGTAFPPGWLRFVAYEPEVARYGGPHGIGLAEAQFESSSRAVLELLERGEWDYESALGRAIQMHLVLLHGCGLERAQASAFSARYCHWWMAHLLRRGLAPQEREAQRAQLLLRFEDVFARQRETLEPFVQAFWEQLEEGEPFEEPWLDRFIADSRRTADQLRRALARDELVLEGEELLPEGQRSQRLWLLLNSLVHMTNNRLGIVNQDESYLAFLLQRSLAESPAGALATRGA